MNKARIDQLIAQLAEAIGRAYNPQKVILFGSHAYGEPTRDSDIDLLIIKETDEGMVDRFVTVKRLIFDPDQRIPVSPLVYTPSELQARLEIGDDFIQKIVSEGRVLYEQAS